MGTFVIGLDTDDKSVFPNTTKVVSESKMDDAQYLDFTPLPGTKMYDDFMKAGSEKAVKEAGLLRSEGRDYVMQEGDIVLFRFNV